MPDNKSPETTIRIECKSLREILSYLKLSVPWLSNQFEQVSGRSLSPHQIARVGEVMQTVGQELKSFKSELSELYVKTPDFQKFFEQILSQIADERSDEKRNIYRCFLADAIKSPCDPFETQIRLLQIMRELRMDQMRLLAALASPANAAAYHVATPLQTIEKRLPDLHRDRIEGLLTQMNESGLIRLDNWKTARTGGRGEKLSEILTPLGQRLLRFAQKA
jgi:AraC-like DNA-binding protein